MMAVNVYKEGGGGGGGTSLDIDVNLPKWTTYAYGGSLWPCGACTMVNHAFKAVQQWEGGKEPLNMGLLFGSRRVLWTCLLWTAHAHCQLVLTVRS